MANTTTDADDSGALAILDTGDVARAFKAWDTRSYAAMRREFYGEVNLNPFKRHPKEVLQLIEWLFWDWFAFECSIVGMVSGNGPDEWPRLTVEHGADGISPFLVTAELLHDHTGRIDDDQLDAMRALDDTNFASMFWIRDASAIRGRILVEDLIHGGEYDVLVPTLAAQYDGAHGGLIVNRIAKVRGAWRFCAVPVYETRRPDSPEARQHIAQMFRGTGYQPDFAGLVRLFYGRTKDAGLDWEDALAAFPTI